MRRTVKGPAQRLHSWRRLVPLIAGGSGYKGGRPISDSRDFIERLATWSNEDESKR